MKNIAMVLLVVITVASVAAAAFLYGKMQVSNLPAASPSLSPSTMVATTPKVSPTVSNAPSASPIPQKGRVTGKLCYPSSTLPSGKIVAKNIVSKEEFVQNYPGLENGGKVEYSFDLPVGSYRLKYDVSGPGGSIIGYYTTYSKCANNLNDPECTGQKTRDSLVAEVKAGQTVTDVNLCDFYYSQESHPQF